jgi:hypothetical protein
LTVVGCTGHQTLTPATQQAVADAVSIHLRRLDDGSLEGVCSLAVGADQIFARALLAAGGRLHVVVPSANYASTFKTEEARASYAELLSRSASSEELPFPSSSEEAFMAAGRTVADRSEVLLAVWDGAPAAGLGGTADIVRYAQKYGKTVEIVWPEGARRM